MKNYILIVLILSTINIFGLYSQKKVYKIKSEKIVFDSSNKSFSNSRNKLATLKTICKSLHCNESIEYFYPLFLEEFTTDTIKKYSSINMLARINVVCNKKNEIVELSYDIRNIMMNEYLANALLNIENKLIGKKINFTHQCPNSKYFFISWTFRFTGLNSYVTSSNNIK